MSIESSTVTIGGKVFTGELNEFSAASSGNSHKRVSYKVDGKRVSGDEYKAAMNQAYKDAGIENPRKAEIAAEVARLQKDMANTVGNMYRKRLQQRIDTLTQQAANL